MTKEYVSSKEKERREKIHAYNLHTDTIGKMVMGFEDCETACPEGCVVEPDGTCPHGYRSPLKVLGIH